MLEAIVSSLVVAVVTAAAWMAYNHPTAWREISTPVMFLGLLVITFYAGWIVALSKATVALIPLVESYKKLEGVIAQLKFDPGLFFVGSVGFIFYVQFLDRFVSRLKERVEEQEVDETQAN